jgi:hypothetical protein
VRVDYKIETILLLSGNLADAGGSVRLRDRTGKLLSTHPTPDIYG